MTTKQRREAVQPRTVEDRVTRMAGEAEVRRDPLVALSTRIPESIRKRVRMAALDNDKDVQDVVEEALRSWLAKHERGAPGQ